MHISLDSALGRQRRLNSVGENVLQIAPDAAAAYSLRSLTGGDPKVVRVRRASDNGERDFTSSDVTSGEMLRWVNTQAIKPLDIQALEADGRTGDFLIAKAAYSLRSLGTRQATLAATGDTVARANDKFVAQVRRNVNGDLKSFTATEVSDGTLTSFVNESFTSSLPLDVSGSASAAYGLRNLSSSYSGNVVEVRRSSDDTTQNFKASEVTNGTLVNFVNEDINKLDLQTASGGLDGNVTNKTATGFDLSVNNEGSIGQQRILSPSNATEGIYNVTFDVSVTSGSLSGITATITSDNRAIVVGSNSQNFTLTSANNGGAIFFRTAADAVADVSITNITLTQTSSNGHVKTWYDQSGNSRDAVQATAASQPKIVDAGVIVTDRDGKLALNGKGAKLDPPTNAPMLSTDGTYSLFAVVDFDDQRNGNDNFYNILRFESTTAGGAASARKPLVFLNQASGSLNANSPSYSSGSANYTLAETLSVQLFTNIANPTLSTVNNAVYADGVLVGSANNATSANTNNLLSSNSHIFDNQETTVTHFLSEVIYYPSDQSDKRRAIEESISGHYGITLGSFNRDGHVKTWYDQSGNSNDAVQATSANQPKIVNAGVLVTDRDGKLALDGKSSQLDLPESEMLSSNGSYSLFTACDIADQTSGSVDFYDLFRFISDGNGGASSARKPQVFVRKSNGTLTSSSPSHSSGGVDFSASETGSVQLMTSIQNPALSTGNNLIFSDGVLKDSTDASTSVNNEQTLDSSESSLFISTETSVSHFLSEVIYYPSDQSDKRRAIEESIATANGITLGSFNRDGFIKTWYDQSVTNQAGDTATGNHAVQATAASQPKIVSAGSLLNELDFDGTDDSLAIDFGADLSQANSLFMVHQSDTTSSNSNEFFDRVSGSPRTLLDQSGSNYRMLSASSVSTGVAVTTDKSLVFALYNGASSLFAKNGTATSALDAGTQDINQNSSLGSSGSNFYNGSMQEFIVYNSDQSANRTAIEANIGEAYSIDLPSGVDPGFDQVDGFVETWYDQSGNSNDAVQATAGSQPKIVNAGTMLNELDFDGTDDNFELTSVLGMTSAGAVFSVAKSGGGSDKLILDNRDSGVDGFRLLRLGNDLEYRWQSATVDTGTNLGTNTKFIAFANHDGSNASAAVNGATATTTSDTSSMSVASKPHIGARSFSSASNFWDGTINELIIYNSDQNANRSALQTNINSHYSIF